MIAVRAFMLVAALWAAALYVAWGYDPFVCPDEASREEKLALRCRVEKDVD